MTDLRMEPFSVLGRKIGADSQFPCLQVSREGEIIAKLDEDDGLFIGCGMFQDFLPYARQDSYDTPEERLTFQAVVLENDFLKAVFLPELGGRLWSLYDKEHQQDLILANTRILPCNLGIRNAWIAGGIEYNCGRRGHDEQTLSPRFAAIVETKEFPVLRIYEYQRDRGTPFQYDCFLPEGSRFLYVRGRIWNPNQKTIPMYWWTNMALPESEGARVVVPAQDAFAISYIDGRHILTKIKLPDGEGFDGTYPKNFPSAKDHFYDIPEDHRRYECLFYPNGHGFCHVSTRRLRGRKLFVWGQGQGGRHWNRKLLGPDLDSYIELQAGLARTQQECMPMPPRTAWEWLEGYGAISMPPDAVHGAWDQAVRNTTEKLDQLIPEADLETMLRETRDTIAKQPGKVICSGSGWGALEELRSGEKLEPQLDFGAPGAAQGPWLELLRDHRITASELNSYLVAEPWFNLLKEAAPSWQTHYHLALNFIRRKDWTQAERELLACAPLDGNRLLLHALANVKIRQGKPQKAAEMIFQAGKLSLADPAFVKECLKTLDALGEYEKMLKLYDMLPQEVAQRPLIRMLLASASAHTGALDSAEKTLRQICKEEIPDIREGENSTSQLYIFIKTKQAELRGETLLPEEVDVPFSMDLRMSPNVKK